MGDRFANRIVNREDGVSGINISMDFTYAVASLKSMCIMDDRPNMLAELSRVEMSMDPDEAQRILDAQVGVRRVEIDRARFLCVIYGENVSVLTLVKVQRAMACWEEAMSETFVGEWSE